MYVSIKESSPRPRGSAALQDAIRQQLAAFDLTSGRTGDGPVEHGHFPWKTLGKP